MTEVPPALVWWGAGLGFGALGLTAFLVLHGPGRRRAQPGAAAPPLPGPKFPVPAPLRGEFTALSDRPDRELDQALRLWAAMAAAAGCRVTVEASADASGNPASNRRLVAGRARAAVLRLREAGIADGNIEVVHLSPGSAPTEQARQRLRSVVLRARPG